MRALSRREPMGADPADAALTEPCTLVQGCRHPKEELFANLY